jgi:hypothetical protein
MGKLWFIILVEITLSRQTIERRDKNVKKEGVNKDIYIQRERERNRKIQTDRKREREDTPISEREKIQTDKGERRYKH